MISQVPANSKNLWILNMYSIKIEKWIPSRHRHQLDFQRKDNSSGLLFLGEKEGESPRWVWDSYELLRQTSSSTQGREVPLDFFFLLLYD